MPSWRVLVHAMDRTGPPMLALAFVRWLRAEHSSDEVHVIGFRGGDLRSEFERVAPVEVILDPSEAWNHHQPRAARVAELRERMRALPPVDASLLVSVAAGQALDLLTGSGRVITWVVEQGEDLHWLDPPVGVAERTDAWLGGSPGICDEVRRRLNPSLTGGHPEICLAPEFIEQPRLGNEVEYDHRSVLARGWREVVVGAGIGTHRKAPDLFMELAAVWSRRHADEEDAGHRTAFVWIGGTDDPLVPLLRTEAERIGLDRLRFMDPVAGIDDFLGAADLFVHPARLDAFPLVCLHAAACGTPVVAFQGCGGVEDMLGSAFRGVPYPDIEALADLAEAVLFEDRESLAQAQRARVTGRFTSESAAPFLYARMSDEAARSAEVGGRP